MLSDAQFGLGQFATLVGLLLLLGQLSPAIPVVLTVVLVPRLWAEGKLIQLSWDSLARRSKIGREMDYCAQVATGADAAKEVRIFGVGDYFLRRFQSRSALALDEVRKLRLHELRTTGGFGTLSAVVLAAGFWYVSRRVASGDLTLGDLTLYVAAATQLESVLRPVANWYRSTYDTLLHLRGLFGFLDGAGEDIAVAKVGEGVAAPSRLSLGVELRDVRFRYPESQEDVLVGVSALLEAGKVTALVGANGAGKSTLVKLITRMYDPSEGEILLDGERLATYELASLRSRMSAVYQDFAHLSLTLRDNIAMAAAEPDGDGRIEEAARWAGADAVAAKLPDGYDTELTRRFEGGVDLSGGEWQRVALARAFVRDAALVILDEPTAALDAKAEYQLFLRFRELAKGKTALLISHRLSTVRMADRILVLEDGRIVEEGSHAELVARRGRYAALYEMQAGRYRG